MTKQLAQVFSRWNTIGVRLHLVSVELFWQQTIVINHGKAYIAKLQLEQQKTDNKSQRLVGFHMVGDDAAEITQIISTLINKKINKSDLDNTIPLHPSTSEEIMTMRDMVTKEI